MTDQVVQVAVVGAGWWSGSVHLPAVVAHPGAELVAVCDADPERARTAAEMFGARRWTTDVEELPGMGVDCAVVATPHDAHHEPAGYLLEAGVDVLVEKPMTIHPRDAWDLVERATRSGARLHVGYPFLHSVQAGALRRLVRECGIGDPVLLDALLATAVEGFYRGDFSAQQASGAPFASRSATYSSTKRGGGQLLTQVTHAVALALWCLEDPVERVLGLSTSGGRSEVDDVDVVSARMDRGTLLAVSSTGTVHENDARTERYTLFGTAGHALLDTVTSSLVVTRPGRADETLATAADGPANAVRAPLAALVATRLSDVPVVVDGALGARVVEVLWAARTSAASGRAVRPTDWTQDPAADVAGAGAR